MRWVLVTGAYGGMGRAAARALAAEDFGVLAPDRTVGAPEPGIVPVEADVTDADSLRRAAETAGQYRRSCLPLSITRTFTGWIPWWKWRRRALSRSGV